MVSEAPPFWWTKADWRAWALWPLSAIYGAVARKRLLNAKREKVAAPVLCVGNLTVGGSGKTPVAVALALAARNMGLEPGILSRGHGGSVGQHPHLVDPDQDSARYVGDEPLLLARAAPVAVTPDRAAGARLLINHGCNFLIMDDGFQSARIHIDYALIVIDARRGIGNGHTIPGGPMRAPLIDQMRFADGLLKMGTGSAADTVVRKAARAGRPFFQASVRPHYPEGLSGTPCLAFAGIGDPSKFFDTVRASGAELVVEKPFGDHHFFSEFDAQDLLSTADEKGLQLVTTAKDYVRLDQSSPAMQALRERTKVIEIEADFELERTPQAIIQATLDAWRRRRLAG
ncbi:tetraacyldisaccharide 4'-kinase [Aquamicrobium zhengzhouense]|uniref:Tetraacyldisaccharide 4'-kinase n=1 Tax=Aquamicrobium zhengzhouense TaxID=2781738 RepID=A0ABS0SCW4_9HYPH|nr:tetraacyldisaccharide 4'-kinase [Aquamicrobium zhengzhouense]MBI1621149.1 tetraacyldisaccharide 4'-kinase [Aquamicrobium zhengzhouense]